MGFTIEDMLVVSSDRYRMKLEAGHGGWSNSISWLLMLEDLTIIRNFSGKELAVTTGLGFQSEEALLDLVKELSAHDASGLIVNTGYYIMEIPESVLSFCNENALPLLTVPWEIYLADMIKDMSIRIFLQSSTDEQISGALIHAIENPMARDLYERDLLPYYDLDGKFQVALISTGDLDKMDTVERKRISYRLQIYLANLTHNGHFFYYASYFVVVMNAVEEKQSREILTGFADRAARRLADRSFFVGVSDAVEDITNLHVAYRRARAACAMAVAKEQKLVFFEEMGVYRLLYSIDDASLLTGFVREQIGPLLDYDREHNTEYTETLAAYLRHGGSVRAVADEMFIHRNTILYRMTNIRKLLNMELESPEERLRCMLACMIHGM